MPGVYTLFGKLAEYKHVNSPKFSKKFRWIFLYSFVDNLDILNYTDMYQVQDIDEGRVEVAIFSVKARKHKTGVI